MSKLRIRRKPLGSAEHTMSAPIPEATVCSTNPKVIERMNRELRKKCERQREFDMATEAMASQMRVV